MNNFTKIKEAVLKNHGGFNDATDAQIMTLWNSLPKEVKKQYLDAAGNKEKKNADST